MSFKWPYKYVQICRLGLFGQVAVLWEGFYENSNTPSGFLQQNFGGLFQWLQAF